MMANEQTLQRYWKRCGYVEIEDDDHQMVVFASPTDIVGNTKKANVEQSLDFRFQGEKWGDIYGRFSVGILGMSMDRISKLTTWSVAQSVLRRRRIRVFAGYESDFSNKKKVSPIFDGFVLSAMPTNPPETWMNFDCIRFYETNQPIEEAYSMSDSLYNIAKTIADINNIEFNKSRWHAKHVKMESSGRFEISGSKTVLIHKFAAKFNLKIVTNPTNTIGKNGAFDIYDARPWLNKPWQIYETVKTETGMLAIGNIDMKGAKPVIRLSDRHGICDWIKLESRLVKCANTPYMIISKNLKGHLRGQDWQTELNCVRYGALI